MTERKIKSIYWVGDDSEHLPVGWDGITEMREVTENLGEYGIKWIEVYKGEELFARHNARFLGGIIYEQG